MFIVFEGLDGAGKDTQLRKVMEYYSIDKKHLNIVKTQEPSGFSDSGKEIVQKLQGEGFDTPLEALELYIKDRVEMNEFKKFNLGYGMVLSSRGDYTTYSYQSIDQGENKGFSFDDIHNKHIELSKDNKLLIPDLTFYLDLPIEETMNRINSRLKEGEKRDFFEKSTFLEKARTQYLKAIDYLRKKENRKIYIIDATKSVDDIFSEIKSIIDNNI